MQKKKWTETEIASLKSLYEDGMKASFIARHLKRSVASINRALCRYNLRQLQTLTPKKTPYKIRDEHIFPLLKILPFAHVPLVKPAPSSYAATTLVHQYQKLEKAVPLTAQHEAKEQDIEETTTALIVWLNRHTTFQVTPTFVPQFKKEIYAITTQRGERKLLSKEGLITLATTYRARKGTMSRANTFF